MSVGMLLIASGVGIVAVSLLVKLLEPKSQARARAAKRRERSDQLVARLSRDMR